ncbi:MAG: hypothetical protein QXX68_03455 [Candidatus Pacearchaeota archaeon]
MIKLPRKAAEQHTTDALWGGDDDVDFTSRRRRCSKGRFYLKKWKKQKFMN